MRSLALALALLTPAWVFAGDAPADEVIGQLLQERVELGFEGTPLGQALDLLQDAVWLNVVLAPEADAGQPLEVPCAERSVGELIEVIERERGLEHRIYCDVLYLHPRGAPPVAPVPEPVPSALPGYTFRFRGESLRDALNLVLELAGLKLVVPEPLAAELEKPVRLRARNLPLHLALTLITDRVGLSWAFDGEAVHLAPLPRPAATPAPDLEARLAQPLTLTLEEPLPALIEALAGAADVAIQTPEPLATAPASLRLAQTPLRAALDQLCADAGLRWEVRDGAIVIAPAPR